MIGVEKIVDNIHSHTEKRFQMSNSHTHDHMATAPTLHEKNMHEYRNYCWLFIIGSTSAVTEFFIAIIFAHSISAQADAIHALTHLSLYALALWVSRQVFIRQMDAHTAHHYREKFLIFYALFVFIGLAWISYTSVVKLLSSDPVVSSYMLLSGSVGLCGNIIALKILHAISKIHGDELHTHAAHQWISLDAWGDFAFSVIVVYNALTALLPIHIIDVIASLCAVLWIGWSGIQIFKKKQI